MSRTNIRFLRRGEVVELVDVDPNETLVDYLRLTEGVRGTKEGCAEGDCGACTIALGSLCDGRVVYEPVNSCIQLLGMVDGKEVVVVDDLADSTSELHPVQQAMVDHHGSQCGFCTPVLVMSLFTLYHHDSRPDRSQINDWLAGNLCRCTGYRPIVDAALESCTGEPDDRYSRQASQTFAQLSAFNDDSDVFVGDPKRFFASPASLDALAELYVQYSDAHLVAGATDVGLWITKQLRDLPRVIWLGRVTGLADIHEDNTGIVIGAGATYAQAESQLSKIDADIGELIRRLGSKQVRAAGTVGGNVANGSPIGDCPPMLMALDTRVGLRFGSDQRELALEAFFIDYGKQDRRAGEFVSHLSIGCIEPVGSQGLYTKVAQVVAAEFGIELEAVRVTATKTDKVPNTEPTAASSGSDLNGMAAKRAAQTIKKRLVDMAARLYRSNRSQITFAGNQVRIGGEIIGFAELTQKAFVERVSLSSTGYYATPKITWDRHLSRGRPFLYFAYGAACSEVTVDTLTGEMRVDAVDILHDVGRSLNPAIDIGQIEGAFVQGMGWLTSEELVFDDQGRLQTHAPSTYKIPTCADVPEHFRVSLWDSKGNREQTVYRSKAVGEPPLMLALSVFSAITHAIASLAPGRVPPLDAPATPQAIMQAVRAVRDGLS